MEMAVAELTRALAERRHQVSVACEAKSPLEAKLHQQRLPTVPLRARDYWAPGAVRQLRAWFQRDTLDVVHAHRSTDLWLIRQAAWGLGNAPRLVWTSHMLFRRTRKRGPGHRWLYRGVDRVIALSRASESALATLLPLRPEQLVVIPHGIDLAAFDQRALEVGRPFREELGLDAQTAIILVPGRLDPKKGQDDAIRALAQLKATPRPHLALAGTETAGEPGEEARLRELARAAGVASRVHWLGHRLDVPALLRQATLVCVPSHAETFGLVLLEAMAAAAPLVATQSGGAPEVAGDAAAWVPPRDPAALAAALDALLADATRRRQLAARGRARVEAHFERDRAMSRLEATYAELAQHVAGNQGRLASPA